MPTRRLKLTLQYDGGPFAGWQRQGPGQGTTVQETLEAALGKVLKERVTVIGAGRTDAGVHARAMAAHVDIANRIPAERLALALAPHLPREVAVLAAEEVDGGFDARRDAILRWYRYQLAPGRIARPLGGRTWRVSPRLDVEAMRATLEAIEGEHDFRAFRVTKCAAKRTRLTMREASMIESEGTIALDFKCRSFLQRMVRLLVGAAVGVGMGKFRVRDVARALKTGERPNAIRSAPSEGLCLMGIAYDEDEAARLLTSRPAPPSF